MRSFSKSIAIPERGIYNFHFARVYTINGTRYFVMVHDRHGIAYNFSMQQSNDSWQLVDSNKSPQWLINLEADLEKAILEQLV